MLLTLPAPPKADLDLRHPHDFPPLSTVVTRPSPDIKGDIHASLPASASNIMTGSHRGLPPPAAMNLPDPSRGPPPSSHGLGQLPAPPQWQGAEDQMRTWLFAKTEEEKRRQEEERTRQEMLRLEQRKVEQQMLQDSMRGGIPPTLVPLIFAGIGGSNLTNLTVEWLQQYIGQLQNAQQNVQQQQQPQQQQLVTQPQLSPERARDTRFISQGPGAYGVQQQSAPPPPLPNAPALQAQPLAPSQQQQPPPQQHAGGYAPYSSGPLSPASRARLAQTSVPAPGPTSAPRPPQQTSLPRLTTNEMQIQNPPPGPPHNPHPQAAQVAQQDQPTASPSIYFHHWVPPAAQSEKKKDEGHSASNTGAKRAEPQAHYPASHISDTEYTSSPKRRKTQSQGQGPPLPPPTQQHQQQQGQGQQQQTSPAFSQASSSTSTPGRRGRAHSRTRSDVSSTRGGYDASGRPVSRQDIQSESSAYPDPSSEAHRSHQSTQRGVDERLDSGGSGSQQHPSHVPT